MISEPTAVYLTDKEALLFISFQKHHALIGLLESLGVFDIKSGSVTIHFNALGEIATVDKQQHFRVDRSNL